MSGDRVDADVIRIQLGAGDIDGPLKSLELARQRAFEERNQEALLEIRSLLDECGDSAPSKKHLDRAEKLLKAVDQNLAVIKEAGPEPRLPFPKAEATDPDRAKGDARQESSPSAPAVSTESKGLGPQAEGSQNDIPDSAPSTPQALRPEGKAQATDGASGGAAIPAVAYFVASVIALAFVLFK